MKGREYAAVPPFFPRLKKAGRSYRLHPSQDDNGYPLVTEDAGLPLCAKSHTSLARLGERNRTQPPGLPGDPIIGFTFFK